MTSANDDDLRFSLFGGVDTSDVEAVAAFVAEIESRLFGSAGESARIRDLFDQVAGMFAGKFSYFQAMDTPYHDFEHTLQATVCWAQLVLNWQSTRSRPHVFPEFFLIGLVAVLLHDIGYLKEEADEHGTGAKFTFVHERRSCDLAQICLSASHWPQRDIFAVQHIISCTGPRAVIDTIPFRHRLERLLGQMVCTADYLGQLSDPLYVQKIPQLYAEFLESDNFRGIPLERRLFKDVEDLRARTSEFWTGQVWPRLEQDCRGLHRLLADARGKNHYLEAIQSNLRRLAVV